jgi:hypothetical protein
VIETPSSFIRRFKIYDVPDERQPKRKILAIVSSYCHKEQKGLKKVRKTPTQKPRHIAQ